MLRPLRPSRRRRLIGGQHLGSRAEPACFHSAVGQNAILGGAEGPQIGAQPLAFGQRVRLVRQCGNLSGQSSDALRNCRDFRCRRFRLDSCGDRLQCRRGSPQRAAGLGFRTPLLHVVAQLGIALDAFRHMVHVLGHLLN